LVSFGGSGKQVMHKNLPWEDNWKLYTQEKSQIGCREPWPTLLLEASGGGFFLANGTGRLTMADQRAALASFVCG